VLAQRGEDLVTVLARHHQVEQDDGRAESAER
jgi:hypothetical protein